MGKVIVTLTLTNWVDKVLAERGFIPEEDIRSCVYGLRSRFTEPAFAASADERERNLLNGFDGFIGEVGDRVKA